MLTATSHLTGVRTYFEGENRDLLTVVINSTSGVEANLALQVLSEQVPEKALVGACNLREVLSALPSSPFSMRVDEDTLVRAADLERGIAILQKELPDELLLAVTTAGNLVLDLIVKADGEKYFWNSVPIAHDFVTTDMLDLIIDSDHLLDEVIKLVQAMGLVFNPKFYLSLEDWALDYAEEVFSDLSDLF